ncbi:MAG TPA: prepilin-type N-terminal cleavage/methylation domain-containing protein [Terriglobales bacterium]|jgi:prepilin-type N-terminal cleavage/methylation domain-containing protein|nr:prepilin-type N-terminal cleavage/methylation domain-containing protein [Terriglobales bacterium]
MKTSCQQRFRNQRGFSLVELLVAMAITIIVMAAAMMMFMKSLDTNDMTMLIAEMQANARAGTNALAQDINQAGTGIAWGGYTLAQGPAENFGNNATYMNPNNFYTVPASAGPPATPATNVMYGITPVDGGGPAIAGPANNGAGAPVQMDGINLVYADPVLSSSDPTVSNWTTPPAPGPAVADAGANITITMPNGMLPAVNDNNSGIRIGDVLTLNNSVVGVVSNVAPGPPAIITLSPGDPYNINQFGPVGAGTPGSVRSLAPYPISVNVMRLYVITYFLQGIDAAGNPVTKAAAATAVDFRLMRQVNQQAATIVAEHINYLQFSYDLGDPSCLTTAPMSHIPNAVEPTACGIPTAKPAYDKIRTVYINLGARSAKPDKRGVYYQTTVNTTVGPRSLSYNNTYPADKP